MASRSFVSRIGPAFVVGACIIGPGSVTMMSTTGANYGYSMIWLSLLSGVLMAGFLVIFLRLGIYSDDTFLGLTAKRLGRWYAVLCGITLFSVDATFQFGNALGVKAGMHALMPDVPAYIWPVLFTVAAIVFLFGLKDIYRAVEKLMTFFLVFMVLAFLINVIWARPNVLAILKGACIPTLPQNVSWNEGPFWVTIGGLVATTFVIVAAFLQPYLVKAKGWTEKDLRDGILDTVLASIMLTLVGAMIMITAAAVLYVPGREQGSVNFEAMIGQLKAFGPAAKFVFGIGFFAAAFSSFITNSLIGGVLLNDGLGFGGKFESRPTKIFATLVLLIGMSTALCITYVESTTGVDLTVKAICVGQAATLLAVPLATVAMVVVLFDRRTMGKHSLSLPAKAFVLFGAAVLLGNAALMCVKIWPAISSVLGSG